LAEHALPTTVPGSIAEHPIAHEHAHPPYLRHHFETIQQQHEASSFGMWLFLLTEFMLFGGMFMAYMVYRNWYYPAFVAGSDQLSIVAGTINTLILITSSLTMALAVHAARMKRQKSLVRLLITTIFLGVVFLGIKATEWHKEWVDHHVPGINFSVEEFVNPPAGSHEKALPLDLAERTQVYFSLYFAMTGMHALHMIIGICLLAFLAIQASGGAYTQGYFSSVENIGLYWHFIDIVWTFLFPLLYLVNRHS
jgi:cytochrome c oxidase subunit 3